MVGTPYYFSPELVQASIHCLLVKSTGNEQSRTWAPYYFSPELVQASCVNAWESGMAVG